MKSLGAGALVATVAACGPLAAPPPPPPPAHRIAIVAAERASSGMRLVAIDEHGDRQFELVQPAATAVVRDTNPTVSPDGQWIVFASSRDRPLDQTSLWIAHAGMTMPARRLTQAETPAVIDAHPTWTPDGRAVVFSSTRDGGGFDLWQLAIHDGQPGELRALTHGAGHEVTPAIAPDGTIVYAEVTPDEATHQVETHLEARAPDGTIRRLTAGPADSSPALSPDGQRLVFSRPAIHNGKPDGELWLIARSAGADFADAAKPLVDLPLTDESGPVWSRDGRFVFATSVVRGSEGNVVFSSIIHVDTRETPRVARLLEDRVGAIVRLTPALTAVPLDVAALHGDPAYLPELARILIQMVERARQDAVPAGKP
jgi:Tol biopolymer transport system component